MCVGARYEISDAAIERYLAERQAMRRAPARAARRGAAARRRARPFAAAEAALDAAAVSADTVMELVADALGVRIGDLAVARELSRDGDVVPPGRRPPPRSASAARRSPRRSGAHALEVDPTAACCGTVADGEPRAEADRPAGLRAGPASTRKRCSTSTTPGIHSMIVAPARAGRATVVGLVAVTRDAPGRPYTA